MDRVKVVIRRAGKEAMKRQEPKTAFGLDLHLVHPETGEELGCRDVHLSFPMEDVVTATAEFIVSEIVVGAEED